MQAISASLPTTSPTVARQQANAPVQNILENNSQAESQVEAQVARQVAAASSGAEVDVQYRYGYDANGNRIIVGATVRVTEEFEKASIDEGKGGVIDNDNPLNAKAKLSASERAYLRQLQAADAAVRTHEALHFRAAGGLGQLPQYQTVTGPDGNQYAVGGYVNVSSTANASPEKAARDAQTLVNAATAPGDASAQDLNAAKQFSQQALSQPPNIDIIA